MRARINALQRRITAYHEAAHAVVAFRFGIPLYEVALCKTGFVQGYVHIARDRLASLALQEAWNHPASALSWTLIARDTEHHAMLSLAGSLAEAKLLGTKLRSHCCESDLRECELLCGELAAYRDHLVETQALSLPKVSPADLANRLRRRTLRTLSHPSTWRAVTALARDLEGWSRLSGHEAADTVQWTRRIRNQLTLLLPMPQLTSGPQYKGMNPGTSKSPAQRASLSSRKLS
jgi:hypothetical protein